MTSRSRRDGGITPRVGIDRVDKKVDKKEAVLPSGRTASVLCAPVPPAGFEPAHPPPEGGALSPELRGREEELYRTDSGSQPVGTVKGSGVAPRLANMSVMIEISDVCASSILLAKFCTTLEAAWLAA